MQRSDKPVGKYVIKNGIGLNEFLCFSIFRSLYYQMQSLMIIFLFHSNDNKKQTFLTVKLYTDCHLIEKGRISGD